MRQPAYDTGRVSFVADVTSGTGEVLVKSSYHRFWRLAGAPGARLAPTESGLMTVADLPAGEHRVNLEYAPPRWPWLATLLVWLGIVGLASVSRHARSSG